MNKLSLLLSLVLLACSGQSEQQLSCANGGVITTENGDRRLKVVCSEQVKDPPAECDSKGSGVYLCNTLHTYTAFCDAFVGLCQ